MRPEFNLFLFLLSILLITSCSNDSDPETPQKPTLEIDFVLTLGGSKNESAQAVTKTNDGGYACIIFLMPTMRSWTALGKHPVKGFIDGRCNP